MEALKSMLMNKNGLAATELSRRMLTLTVGDKIPTITQFAELLGLSRGTLQNGIKLLQQYGAIGLEPRGHLGTFLSAVNYPKLLEVAGRKSLVGVMPLPCSRHYEGLATGLISSFERPGRVVLMNLAYMRGANNRIGMLLDGRYDFAVMSKLAADHHIERGTPVQVSVDLGEGSFLSSHVLILRDSGESCIKNGMKVGIDYDSTDHCELTRRLCSGYSVSFVPMIYSQLVDKVLSGEIDAAIWNQDEISDKRLNINWKKIDHKGGDDTRAVLVVDKNKPELCSLIRNIIDPCEVLHIQGMVERQQMLPNY